MQQVFVNADRKTEDHITITGNDARHLSKVVRLRIGEKLRVSTSEGESFLCETESIDEDRVTVRVLEAVAETELPNKIYLFQAIPKGSRFETVIEKTVELGVFEIIPVAMKHCVVKWDDKKSEAKVRRLQAIAESAAKQSKRSRIPEVKSVMSYREALSYAKSVADVMLFPYENKDGMEATEAALNKVTPGNSVSIFIGPEGGFSDEEYDLAKESMDVISLGERILRTDTAAIVAVAMVMLNAEMRRGELQRGE